jgi:DnaK suppressor protein
MKTASTEMDGYQKILERKEAELVRAPRERDGVAIERSADQIDEIQSASERDMEIRNADRESTLLREVRGALRRIHDGSFGTCIECDWPINANRLVAVPWAVRCVVCQEAADSDGQQRTESVRTALGHAA